MSRTNLMSEMAWTEYQHRLREEAPVNYPPYDVYPTNQSRVPTSGVLSSVRTASAENGALLAAEYVTTSPVHRCQLGAI